MKTSALLLLSSPLAIAALAMSATAQTTAENFRIVPEGQLGRWWISDRDLAPRYPIEALQTGTEGCISVAFAVHGDGTARPVRVLREVWSSANKDTGKLFEQLVTQSLTQARFSPAPTNKDRLPVYTYLWFTYRVEGSKKTEAELQKPCEVPDFIHQTQQGMSDTTASAKS